MLQSSTAFEYDEYGNVTRQTVKDPDGTVLSDVHYAYTYHSDGSYQLRSWTQGLTDADGNTTASVETIQEYDRRGRLISQTDPNGNTTTYTYDTLGRLLSETYPDGAATTFAYDTAGNTICITDANGGQQLHSYTPMGKYESVQVKQDGKWRRVYDYTYDEQSRKVGETEYREYDASGNAIQRYSAAYTLDNRGRLTSQHITDASGNTITGADYQYSKLEAEGVLAKNLPLYSGEVNLPDQDLSDKTRTETHYHLVGNYAQFDLHIGGKERPFTAKVYGDGVLLYSGRTGENAPARGVRQSIRVEGVQVLSIVTGKAAVSSNTSKAYAKPSYLDQVTILPQAGGGQESPKIVREIDLAGNILHEETGSASGAVIRTTQNTYDALGNLLTTTTGDRTTSYGYNYQNKLIRQTDPDGSVRTSAYDGAGQLVSETDRAGNIRAYTYDLLGRQTVQTAPFQNGAPARTKLYYDAAGNLIRRLTQDNQPGQAEHFRTESFTYDNRNRLSAAQAGQTEAERSVTQYTYDALGNLTAAYTGLSAPIDLSSGVAGTDCAVTRYEYNSLGQMVRKTDALGQVSTYAYDLAGNLRTSIDREGIVTTTTYNLWGKPIRQLAAKDGETQTVTYTYGRLGQLLSATSADGERSTYSYDALGRLTSEQTGDILNTYTYDAFDNRTGYTLASAGAPQQQTSYTYDVLNRLTGVDTDGETTSYTYDLVGNLLSEQTGSLQTSYTYNLAGLPLSKQTVGAGSQLLNVSYTYRLDGNVAAKQDSEAGSTTYAYDGVGRLTSETTPAVVTQYGYDAYSNRASRQTFDPNNNLQAQVSYAYDKNNRLTNITETVGMDTHYTQLAYDKNGNQLMKQHSSVTDETGEPEYGAEATSEYAELYRYNLFGQLTEMQHGNIAATYTYNAAGLRTSKTVNGVTTQHMLDGANVVADVMGGQTTTYARGLGLISMRVSGNRSYYVTDLHGDVRALTDANGNVTENYSYDAFGNETGTSSSSVNPFRYCGEYQDLSSGLIYLRGRYYDPSVGRFTQEDPIKDGNNWYVYAANNPIRFKDPSGYAVTKNDRANLNPDQIKRLDQITQEYGDAQEAGDIIRMNDLHYEAACLRATYDPSYHDWDDYDYMHGQEVLGILVTHDVMKFGNHAGIAIMVDADSGLYTDDATKTRWGGKVRYVTLGAQEKNGGATGKIVADFNRDDDVNFSSAGAHINLNISKSQADTLINQHSYFRANCNDKYNYSFNPAADKDEWNSNSYAWSLLRHAGISAPNPPNGWWFPGWDKTMPSWMFRP